MMLNTEQLEKMRTGKGFIAALDQSGGSTPKALKLYGIEESAYSGEEEMFDLVHQMRTRIIKSPSLNSERTLGAILFDMTMEKSIDGKGTAEYLWENKKIVPFLKVDNGLATEENGVQVMKSIPELDDRLKRASGHKVFGTKMRSVIKLASRKGIQQVVDQQFEIGKKILAAGLIPIIEPEVDINSHEKEQAEGILKLEILDHLNKLNDKQNVMLKLTLPSQVNFYADLVSHPRVVRVVALSGGYARDEANKLLAKNNGVIASFSRALTEGLSAQQSDKEFDDALDKAVQSIYDASNT
jgi:fructose-bisphosphate aldolase, class I